MVTNLKHCTLLGLKFVMLLCQSFVLFFYWNFILKANTKKYIIILKEMYMFSKYFINKILKSVTCICVKMLFPLYKNAVKPFPLKSHLVNTVCVMLFLYESASGRLDKHSRQVMTILWNNLKQGLICGSSTHVGSAFRSYIHTRAAQ